ncbi:MAG: HAD-IIIC family phosphatase [Lachnospiraceae bacterium]|nr:HAD-IIIC family phosphatase [Lachnospiraceae bacterium]
MQIREVQEEIKNLHLSDYRSILRLAKKVKNIVNTTPSDIKVAVLGSCSIQYFVQVLRLLLYKEGVSADIYEGEYNGIKMDVLNGESALFQFQPDILIILPDYRDINQLPQYNEDIDGINKLIKYYIDDYKNIWGIIKKYLPQTKILQGNFVIPIERVLGNLEANYIFSQHNFIKRLNIELTQQHSDNVVIVDLEYLASLYGKKNWFDSSLYALSKVSFSLQYIGDVVEMFVKLIVAWRGKIKKCIVLDLDNTLWGGIVAEEGWDGIRIDVNDAVGESYLTFQKYLKELNNRGILLAVCSKNDREIAEQPFKYNKKMPLSLNDFASFQANWQDKASNIKKIAEEINIGLDSMVFFDDNPAEREIVRMNLPEVTVVDVPEDPANYVNALDAVWAFEWLQITPEDYARAETYEKNRARIELQEISLNYDEYLKALEMKANILEVTSKMLKRFVQLINKSNQFNVRTRRYLDTYIESLLGREDYGLIAVSLKDKFSDYGCIACVILQKQDNVCFIDTWVMSCRILKRGLEYLVFQHIYDWADEHNCDKVIGEYIPTEKNVLVKELYPQLGFSEIDVEDGKTEKNSRIYQYDIESRPVFQIYIMED